MSLHRKLRVFAYWGIGLWLGLFLFRCSPEQACEGDSVCPKGQICKEGQCVEGCRSHQDCKEGLSCQEQKCSEASCTPGTQRECYDGPKDTKGKGLCKSGTQTCLAGGKSWTPCQAQVLPRDESCDGADNDCDGKVDEDLDCQCQTPGASRVCFQADPKLLGKGLCKEGIQYCLPRQLWGKCHEQRLPRPELCDTQDNDCDGKVDEDLADCQCPTPGASRSCYLADKASQDRGECKKGTQTCSERKRWGPCLGAVYPKQERCNGKDDDCDGKADNDCLDCFQGDVRACYGAKSGCTLDAKTGKYECSGACQAGTQSCKDGKWGECKGESKPSDKEECNGKDDNCDGSVDEGVTRPCYAGPAGTQNKGICKAGTQTCKDGAWTDECPAQVLPKKEQCNGVDDDCNGQIDDLSRECYTGPAGTRGKGICKAGTQACKDGNWQACAGQILPGPKELCNQIDDDCDGSVDESCPCHQGQRQECGSAPKVGECKKGTQACDLSGTWGSCTGEIKPSPEICDGKDNNCDGSVDEGVTRPCYTGPAGTQNKGICKAGTQTCKAGNWEACTGQILPASKELCDGKDNDCDGTTDEDFPQKGQTCDLGVGACKNAGKYACKSDGSGTSCDAKAGNPSPEVCDGKDNDCDGQTDESLAQLCYTGTTGCKKVGLLYLCEGQCKEGTQTCQNGAWSTCQGAVLPSKYELCDGIDNDCDGKVDQGCDLKIYGGGGRDRVHDLLLDPGNGSARPPALYISGVISGAVPFGSVTPTGASASGESVFVAKFSTALAPQWSKAGGGGKPNLGAASIDRDAAGSLYLEGLSSIPGTWPNSSGNATVALSNNKIGRLMVSAKLDETQGYVWAKTQDLGTNRSVGRAIAVNGSHLYVGGNYRGGITLGPNALPSPGNSTDFAYLAKRNATTGAAEWARGLMMRAGITANRYVYLRDLATDIAGNVYVTGSYYYDYLRYGTKSSHHLILLNSTPAAPSGVSCLVHNVCRQHMFLLKIDKRGAVQWALTTYNKTTNASHYPLPDAGHALLLTSNALYVGGKIAQGSHFERYVSSGNVPTTTPAWTGSHTAFVARVNLISGGIDWVKAFDATDSASIHGMTLDPTGKWLYLQGSFQGKIFSGAHELSRLKTNKAQAAANGFYARMELNTRAIDWSFRLPCDLYFAVQSRLLLHQGFLYSAGWFAFNDMTAIRSSLYKCNTRMHTPTSAGQAFVAPSAQGSRSDDLFLLKLPTPK